MEQSASEEVKKVEQTAENAVEPVKEAAEAVAEAETKPVDETAKAEGGIQYKEQLKGKVLKLSLAGALVDIGKENPGLLHISQVLRPEGKENSTNIGDLLKIGDEIDVWVKSIKDNRIELTMLKPLALEWKEMKKDMVVKGVVTRLEKFGAFVEIGAERPGLVHISEMAHTYVRQPSDVLKVGDEIEAKVLDFNKHKKQIKLSIKALQPEPEEESKKDTEEYSGKVPAARSTSARAQQLKEGKLLEPHEKTVRTNKKNPRKREEINEDFDLSLVDNTAEEGEGEELTAMQIAYRSAMEKAKERKQQSADEKKKKGNTAEQEDILSRTLNNKVG